MLKLWLTDRHAVSLRPYIENLQLWETGSTGSPLRGLTVAVISFCFCFCFFGEFFLVTPQFSYRRSKSFCRVSKEDLHTLSLSRFTACVGFVHCVLDIRPHTKFARTHTSRLLRVPFFCLNLFTFLPSTPVAFDVLVFVFLGRPNSFLLATPLSPQQLTTLVPVTIYFTDTCQRDTVHCSIVSFPPV